MNPVNFKPTMLSSPSFRPALLACVAALLPWSSAKAADPIALVFKSGKSIPLASVALQGDNLVVNAAMEGFTPGQAFPLASVDHIYGEKPVEINQGIALLLTGKAGEALKILEPILASQRASAKIPGNFWLEPARAALVAYAVNGNAAKCTDIGKEISDAIPGAGIDPIVSLGKALMLPGITKVADRETAFRDLMTDSVPSDLAAYASFYLADVLKGAKRDVEALEAYLSVPCLYPSGGMILTGISELNGAELLNALGRREEAVALFTSAALHTAGTPVAASVNDRLKSLK